MTTDPPAPRRAAIVLVLAGIVALYCVFQVRAFVPAYGEIDPDGYLLLAKRIARLQSPALPDDLFLYNRHIWVEPTPGAVVPKFAPGYPAILAVFYRAFGDEGMFYVSPIMGALTLVGAFFLVRAWTSPVLALFAAATLAVNGAFLFYSGYLLPHATEMCVVTWGMFFLWRWLREPRVSFGVGAGLLLGYACSIRHTEALLALAVGWALLTTLMRRESGWRPMVALASAYAAGPLAMLVYNARVFGGPFVTGYALSEEQLPVSWSAFVNPAPPNVPALSWPAIVANYNNLLHGLSFELMFLVFPLGLLGMLFLGPGRERVLRVLWWVPPFIVYAAYYFSPPNLAYYRFLLAVVPLFIGSAYMLLDRLALTGRASWLLLAALPVGVLINNLGYIERTLANGARPGAVTIAQAARRASTTLRHDAVIFAAPPLHQYLGTRDEFRVYNTRVFSSAYGYQIDDENSRIQPPRHDRLRQIYKATDEELRAQQQEKIRTFVEQGRQVVFLISPAAVDDQEPVIPKGYYLKRVDEWEAPGGGRWGLYAVTPW